MAMTPLMSKCMDGEASDGEVHSLEAHLADCPLCNLNMENMREASVTFRSFVPLLPLATARLWSTAKAGILSGKTVTRSTAGGAWCTPSTNLSARSFTGRRRTSATPTDVTRRRI